MYNLMDNYPKWLLSNFDKGIAKKILLEDFGSPEKDVYSVHS